MEKNEKSTEKQNVSDKKRQAEQRRRETLYKSEAKPRAAEMGTAFHAEEAQNIRKKEAALGTKEANKQQDKQGDFDIEKSLEHPDGRGSRLDYVNYNEGAITDHKQIAHDENLEKFVAKTKPQRTKHIESYEHNREQKKLPDQAKKLREYRYNNLYGSSKDKPGDVANVREVTITPGEKGKETADAELLTDGPLMKGLQNIERRKQEAYKQSGLYDAERRRRHFESQREEES